MMLLLIFINLIEQKIKTEEKNAHHCSKRRNK